MNRSDFLRRAVGWLVGLCVAAEVIEEAPPVLPSVKLLQAKDFSLSGGEWVTAMDMGVRESHLQERVTLNGHNYSRSDFVGPNSLGPQTVEGTYQAELSYGNVDELLNAIIRPPTPPIIDYTIVHD